MKVKTLKVKTMNGIKITGICICFIVAHGLFMIDQNESNSNTHDTIETAYKTVKTVNNEHMKAGK